MKVLKRMMILLTLVSSIQVYASYAPQPTATAPIEVKNSSLCDESVSKCISYYSKKYDVPESILSSIIKCQSSNNPMAHNNSPVEDSWGLVQINLKAHTNITKAQATDPEFAVEFLAKNFDKAPRMWVTCYRKATQE